MKERLPFFKMVPNNAMCLGMSLRDWFAGMIACGVFANPNVNLALINKEPENFNIAIFKCADAMLEERDK